MIRESPFFILANPRSGSSLLRIICESHSQICVPPESGFMEWWYTKYKNWTALDNLNTDKVEAFIGDLMMSKKIETWNLNPKLLESFILREQPNSYASLISLVYVLFGLNNNKKLEIWGDKNNYYIHKTAILNELYPKAKYIHLIRDGRDVATSYIALNELKSTSKYAPKLSSEVAIIAKEWNDNNLKLLAFLDTINEDRILRIHFEDIIKNLNVVCTKIVDFLGVPYEESMLKYYLFNQTKKIEPLATLDWKKKTLEKPDIDGVGKYKSLLTQNEITTFNRIAKQSLIEFGYE